MSKEQDGGPAFPSPMQDDRDCHARNESGYGGLSIRDWFVGQALAGLMANPHPQAISLTAEEKTVVAFTQANAVREAATGMERHNMSFSEHVLTGEPVPPTDADKLERLLYIARAAEGALASYVDRDDPTKALGARAILQALNKTIEEVSE